MYNAFSLITQVTGLQKLTRVDFLFIFIPSFNVVFFKKNFVIFFVFCFFTKLFLFHDLYYEINKLI
jgi:hypothetical protein